VAPCIYLNYNYRQFLALEFPHRLYRYRQAIYWAVAVVVATAMLLRKSAKVRRISVIEATSAQVALLPLFDVRCDAAILPELEGAKRKSRGHRECVAFDPTRSAPRETAILLKDLTEDF
jgi:hypothetical protein